MVKIADDLDFGAEGAFSAPASRLQLREPFLRVYVICIRGKQREASDDELTCLLLLPIDSANSCLANEGFNQQGIF